MQGRREKRIWWRRPLYRGTSLIRNTHPPRITIGPSAAMLEQERRNQRTTCMSFKPNERSGIKTSATKFDMKRDLN